MAIIRFTPGTIARAQDVNKNFDFIYTMLGQYSTTGRLTPPGEIQMGARGNVLLSGAHDKGASGDRYFQISWNADWNFYTGKGHIFERFKDKEPATAVRIGAQGFVIRSTPETTGNLNSQMIVRLRAWRDKSQSWLYLEEGTRIVNWNEPSPSSEKERWTLTWFERPRPMWHYWVEYRSNKYTYAAASQGVPKHARAILVRVELKPGRGRQAALLLYQANEPKHEIREKGLRLDTTRMTVGGVEYEIKASGQGVVPLGTGKYAGKFTIQADGHAWFLVHVLGYYT